MDTGALITAAVPPTQSVVWPVAQRAASGVATGPNRLDPAGGNITYTSTVVDVASASATISRRRRQGNLGKGSGSNTAWYRGKHGLRLTMGPHYRMAAPVLSPTLRR